LAKGKINGGVFPHLCCCPGKDHFMKLFELLEMNGDNIFNSIDLLLLMAYALFMYIFYKNVVTKVIKGKSK
tara:strand:+ start:6174 stop:6386 length:213 start_codon:yes stop_codon:yes gene_type:complete